ncbi:MAG: hypothetical protein ACK2U3_04740 [Anaerolineales bacterium]|jgi:TM2 domain-containing membrane protein YozV
MSRDLRKYTRQTNNRLLAGGIIILFVVGDGLIYLFYGKNAAITGLVCLIAGLLPLIIIWIILSLMGWVVKRSAE